MAYENLKERCMHYNPGDPDYDIWGYCELHLDRCDTCAAYQTEPLIGKKLAEELYDVAAEHFGIKKEDK